MDKSKRQMILEDWNCLFLEIEKMFNESDIMHIGHRDTSIPPIEIEFKN